MSATPAHPFPTPSQDFGAGTDADVFVTLRGTHGSFGPHLLAAQKGAFETGGRDTFSLSTPILGQVGSESLFGKLNTAPSMPHG